MRSKTQVIVFLFAFLAAPLVWAGLINEKAPDFVLQDLSGNKVSLQDLKGKVVFIDFFASWCPPCKKEFPEINRIIDKYNESEVAFIAINIDKKRAHVEDFLSQVPGLSRKFNVLLDPDASVIAAYSAKAMPTSFILDKSGVVRFIHFGYRESDPKSWTEEIDKLLK